MSVTDVHHHGDRMVNANYYIALCARRYAEASGHTVSHVQKRVFHPVKRWMAATLDEKVEATGAVFEARHT